jgi:hypothetical protein
MGMLGRSKAWVSLSSIVVTAAIEAIGFGKNDHWFVCLVDPIVDRK